MYKTYLILTKIDGEKTVQPVQALSPEEGRKKLEALYGKGTATLEVGKLNINQINNLLYGKKPMA